MKRKMKIELLTYNNESIHNKEKLVEVSCQNVFHV
jgi:hypothetical protein